MGLSHQKSLPPNLNHGQPEEPDTGSQTCQRRVHHSTNVDTHIKLHTALSSEDSRVLGVTLLNFSPSFPTLVLPLSWQKLLTPLPPAITLSLSLSSLSFQLPCVFFPLSLTLCSFTLFKLLTSNPSITITYCTWIVLLHPSPVPFFHLFYLLPPSYLTHLPPLFKQSDCSSTLVCSNSPCLSLSLRRPLCSLNSALICLLLLFGAWPWLQLLFP